MDKEMSLVEHLAELRKRLIIVAVAFLLSLFLGFVTAKPALHFISNYTLPEHVEWNVFSYTDGFLIYFKCALLVAVLITLPVFLYEVWAFIRPGLTQEEARVTFFYVPWSFILFLIGVAFSFFILFPMIVQFMGAINKSIGVTETYGISQYFTFLFNIVFPVSLVFELPVVVLFLTRLRILNPQKLKKMRKVSYFLLVIIGVSITPPDFVADLLITVPLILLFEFSIFLSNLTYKKLQRRKEEYAGREERYSAGSSG